MDANGAKLGTIQEIYFDEETNQPATLAINAGGLLDNKHRVVPLELASPSADGIQVPYDKATVKDAPNLDLDDDLPADQVTALYRHYSLNVDNAPNGDAEHTVGR
ncbi:MAG: PRC-barrel domain-containing protein [Actinobacteria bacterium]|nr:PRC-barrel domain-containing protein [Actinomycetota bacterium]